MTKFKQKTKLAEWQKLAQQGGVCNICKLKKEQLTVDHIVPVAILAVIDETGEARYEDELNFQLVCHPCNAFKAGRLDKTNPKTKELLIKYLS